MVVFPTPKPPATTILTEVGPRRVGAAVAVSEGFDAIEDFLQKSEISVRRCCGGGYGCVLWCHRVEVEVHAWRKGRRGTDGECA